MSVQAPSDDSPTQGANPQRIRVLSATLADQIAAGEVVERPASVLKELVENAVDAGATRVEVELEEAGLRKIVVRDDGHGMHPEDLVLALTRHATSKVRAPEDLVEVVTLGFRGEALASMAAVADVVLESRRPQDGAGTRLKSRPGLPPELEPVGMPIGTRVEVSRLFANVPARRKFMRSEATEIGHCSETMLRLAISHPGVHLRLRHGSRTLLDLPSVELSERIEQVLARRSNAPLRRIEGERDGVAVSAFLAPAQAAIRQRHGLFVVVRRRVVKERSLSRIVTAAYGDRLAAGLHPVAAVLVEPPPGTVDVNVHPQKAEVRFADPQRVYSAVRTVLAEWGSEATSPSEPVSAVTRLTAGATTALQTFAQSESPARERMTTGAAGASSYRLRTRAAEADYQTARRQLQQEVAQLRGSLQVEPVVRHEGTESAAPTRLREAPPASSEPELGLLTCLPGPVALVRQGDRVLAVDLKRLRSHLVYLRLAEDLGGGSIAAQGLLQPTVIRRPKADVTLCLRAADALTELGIVVESFGSDALMVRAVPATRRCCVEEPALYDLIDRVLPWLRVRRRDADDGPGREEMLQALSQTGGSDPAPRLARRWLKELLERGVALEEAPGIRVWTAEQLVDAKARRDGR